MVLSTARYTSVQKRRKIWNERGCGALFAGDYGDYDIPLSVEGEIVRVGGRGAISRERRLIRLLGSLTSSPESKGRVADGLPMGGVR